LAQLGNTGTLQYIQKHSETAWQISAHNEKYWKIFSRDLGNSIRNQTSYPSLAENAAKRAQKLGKKALKSTQI